MYRPPFSMISLPFAIRWAKSQVNNSLLVRSAHSGHALAKMAKSRNRCRSTFMQQMSVR